MNIIAYDKTQTYELGYSVSYVDLDQLFSLSDVIVLHCPLFDDTKELINKESIAKMKDGVIIINNSRGELIVEEDLAQALNCDKVYAAGLDVVATEPILPNNPSS
ncbi:MAG: NAD(P)-dependent oxidoreductase [Sphaerochaetaceae bacterium]